MVSSIDRTETPTPGLTSDDASRVGVGDGGVTREVRPADAWLVAIALATGVLFDLAVRREPASVATAVAVAGTSIGLLVSGRLRSPHSRALVSAAPLFGTWAAIRSSPWLIPLNLAAASGLLVLGVAVSNNGRLLELGIRDLLRQPGRLIGDATRTLPFLGRGLFPAARRTSLRQATAVAVGLGLAAPVVLVLLALLASGDALTAAVLSGLSGTGVVDHVVVVSVGAAGTLVLLYRAARADDSPAPDVGRLLGVTEAAVVLASVATLFGAFALLQLVGALGVADELLDDPSSTADWARQGFFQLLWAAGITLGVLLALDAVTVRTSPRHHRVFARLAGVLVALTLVVVASSIVRIVRYSDAFGLTMLRLYSGLFAAWIAVVFVLFGTRLLVPAIGRRWLGAAGAVGLALLLALNVANPEAVVVRWDIAHTDPLDVGYLGRTLSTDAIPALVAGLDSLDPGTAAALGHELCESEIPSDGPLSWNRSRASARGALAHLCGAVGHSP